MAVDLATLAIEVETAGIDAAVQKLDGLYSAAKKANDALYGHSDGIRRASDEYRKLYQNTGSALSSFDQYGRTLGNITRATDQFSGSLSSLANNAMNSLENSLNSLKSTVLGVVTAYTSLKGIMGGVSTGLSYNQMLEDSRVGIAAVVASTQQLADQQGKLLQGQEKFNAALKMSDEMAKSLDYASKASTANYGDLLSTFQTLLAPASQLGLQWKDTLGVTITMSNALSALGIDMERLNSETQAILTGTNLTKSAVAARLGITKDEIAQWGKGEQLLSNIQSRLQAFTDMGSKLENTWKAVNESFRDSLANAAGDATASLFEHLKDSMKTVSEALYYADDAKKQFCQTAEWEAVSGVLDGISDRIGQGIVGAVEMGVGAFKSLGQAIDATGTDKVLANIEDGAKIATAALVTMTLARKAAHIQFTTANGEEIVGLGNKIRLIDADINATNKKIAADIASAKAVRDKAKADLLHFQELQRTSTALRNRQADYVLETTLLTNLQRAQATLTATQIIGSAAVRGLTASYAGLMAVGRGILSIFGGGIGLAITGLTVAISYLATQESSASKYAREHADSMGFVSKNAEESRAALDRYTSSLKAMTQAELDLEAAKQKRLLVERTASGSAYRDIVNTMTPLAIWDQQIYQEIHDRITESAQILLPTNIINASVDDLKTLREEINRIGVEYDRVAEAEKALEYLDPIIANKTKLVSALGTEFTNVGNAASGATGQIAAMQQQLAQGFSTSGLDGFLQKVAQVKQNASIEMAGLKNLSDLSKALPNIDPTKLRAGIDAYAKNKNMTVVEDAMGDAWKQASFSVRAALTKGIKGAVELEATEKQLKAWQDSNKPITSAGGSRGSIAQAAKAQEDWTKKINQTELQARKLELQLNNTASSQEKLILEKTRIKDEYEQKMQANLKEYQNLAGKMSKEELEHFKVAQDRVTLLEKDLKLRDAEKQAAQRNLQITQGQIKFYKELGQLSGNYYDTIDLQNALLQEQANKLITECNISRELAEQWLYFQQLQYSNDPFDGAYRGLLKFQSEYTDAASQWENITYNFGKNFMSTTRDMFDDFLETGKTSFDGFKNLFKQLLKDLAWQALAQPVMLSIVGGITGAMTGSGGAAQAGTIAGAAGGASGTAGSASGMIGDISNGISSMVQNQVTSKLFGSGSGGIIGGITNGINSAVASAFPSMFAASAKDAALNLATMAEHEMAGVAIPQLGTTTFTSALGTASIGMGVGAMASPFVNSLLGLENNTGSQIGSLAGGALGTLGGAALTPMLAAAVGTGPAGWIAAGIAGLAAIAGGGIGSLFGGQKKEKPELYLNVGANLWEKIGTLTQKPNGGSALFNNGGSYSSSSFARAEGNQGTNYQTSQGVAEYLAKIVESGQDLSMSIADTLGSVDKSLKEGYLERLKEQGRIDASLYLDGSSITMENVEGFGQNLVSRMQESMLNSLSTLDLKPLVKVIDGTAGRTMSDITNAMSGLVNYVNIGATIQDEEMREQFNQNVIPQMQEALQNISLRSLTNKGILNRIGTVDKLSQALGDVLSVYDMGEAIQDQNIKAAFQESMREVVKNAFSQSKVMGWIGLDVDNRSFEGIQKAYAATQAWQQVQGNIDEVMKKGVGFAEQIKAANDEFGGWLTNLRELGWRESALAEVEKKRIPYLRKIASQISEEFDSFINPMNEFDKAVNDATEKLDDWISSLEILGYTEKEITELEIRRNTYLEQLQASLERSTSQDLASRIVSLQFGSDSAQHTLYSLLIQQRNELDSLKSQFGEDHYLYGTAINVQGAEMASTLLAQLKSERTQLAEKEITLLQEKTTSIQSEINAANNLVTTFERLTKSIEDYRKNLWTGNQNLSGSRYDDAYRNFTDLYKKAMGGDEEAYNQLTSKADTLLTLGKENLADRVQYNDLYYTVDQMLKNAQAGAAKKQALEEAKANSLTASLEIYKKQQETLSASQNTETKSPYTLETIEAAIQKAEGFLASLVNSLPKPYGNTSEAGKNLYATSIGDLGILNKDYWQELLSGSVFSSLNSNVNKALSAVTGVGDMFASELSAILYPDKKTRGFASGGITPANEVFMVGENGPEYMVSPRQWGVLNNEAAGILMESRRNQMQTAGRSSAGMDAGELRELIGAVAVLGNYMRQVVVKTDQTAWACKKIKDMTERWEAEGIPIAEGNA